MSRATPTRSFKNCQSCGMPFSRDAKGGGTEADGAKSAEFCSHCYERGRFTMPDVTVQEMQSRVKSKLTEAGVPRLMAALLVRRIPKLTRWRRPA